MIGETVGNYVIEAQLGEGGMGAVYKARHVRLGRPAAVKVLLKQFSANPDIVQRFFNEAKAATSIRHLGIIEVYDFGTMADGVAYIAMELLPGESLAARMRKGVHTRDALNFIRLMCGALGAAHQNGIVHRDLKPDNVFVIPDPEVPGGERIKLLDFGIAKLTQDLGGTTSQKTRTGSLMGTPAYMAPEQCRGVGVDLRADIYSLGCILYELVTGRPPFRGEGIGDVLGAHMYKQAVPVTTLSPTLSPQVSQLVERMLEKKPADRPQTTRAVIEAIDAILAAGVVVSASIATAAAGPAAVPTTLSSSATATQDPITKVGRDRAGRHRPGRGVLFGAVGTAMVIVTVVVMASRGDHAGSPPVATLTADAASTPVDAVTVLPPDAAATEPLPGADASTMIQVAIDSVPRGSHVLLDGKNLGTTPYRSTLPRTDRTLSFTIRRHGWRDAVIKAPGSRDINQAATLDRPVPPARSGGQRGGSNHPPVTPESAAAGQHRGSGIGSEESVNPFPSP